MDQEEFKFPDETVIDTSGGKKQEKEPPVEFEIEVAPEAEIEVVDDTPEADKGRRPMKEPPADVTDEELEQYSESVKSRIKHFSKGYHEERRAKEAAQREREEAVRIAQALAEENKKLQGSLGQGQAALLEQAKKVVAKELEEAKRLYKEAYETGDSDKLVEAQEAITAAKIRAERVNNFKPPALQQEQTEVKPAPSAEQVAKPQNVDPKARAWQEANPWFGSDDEMTAVALAVHKKLVERGVDTSSDEYYSQINARIRQLFPDAVDAEPQPKKVRQTQVVAPATRSTAPKKIVLTQSQVNIAKRLQVPLELYAKKVAEEMRKQNG
jgi:hypothetical protein